MKTIRFLGMMLTFFYFASCTQNVDESGTLNVPSSQRQAYVFAYKADDPDLIQTRSASLNSKVWNNGDSIRIKFLNGTNILQNKVKEVAAEWLQYANLKFKYVNATEEADVKIAFAWNGEQVTWSTIGTDCKSVAQDMPSMNLMIFNQNDSEEVNSEDFSAAILREFGHVLGLLYENQGPNSTLNWDIIRVKNYFLSQAWTQSQIDNLLQVYSTTSTNYTEFDEESIMLLFFPNFLTKDNKGSKYNTQLSETDKDFISSLYPGHFELPNKLELTYKQVGDDNVYPYTAVRIGEYYWVNNNFYHQVPYNGWNISDAGGEKDAPITKEMIDTYMLAIHLNINNKDKVGFPNIIYKDIETFYRYFGRYYNHSSIDYMNDYGKIYEGSRVSSNWELPSYQDYRQLFAMCPIVYDKGKLSRQDIQLALAAKYGDNPATSPYYYEVHDKTLLPGGNPAYADLCVNNNHGQSAIHAVYFNTQTDGIGYPNTNMYGFDLMASGARGNNSFTWENDLPDMVTGNLKSHNGIGQYIHQLFYAFFMAVKRNGPTTYPCVIEVGDDIKTANQPSFHWVNVRWCRRLSDAELGYKLYINTSKTDIKKLDLTDAAPSGYYELPKGYLRGFYVQYILDNPSPKYTVADIVEFANNVQDPTK